MSIEIVYDVTHSNLAHAPGGLCAGYTTGSSDIRWTDADWRANPGAVRIDQDAAASDGTADVLDVERGAASPDDVPSWAAKALRNYGSSSRPGQRSPLIYVSQSSVTDVANALAGAKMADGRTGLFIANWDLTQAEAVAEVLAASGPFPVHGVQFRNAGKFDIDVFSSAWLNDVSKPAVTNTASVWGIALTYLAPSRASLTWQTTAGIAAWQAHISGPGIGRTTHLTVPAAMYAGLHGGHLYDFAVVALAGGHQQGNARHFSFRTPL